MIINENAKSLEERVYLLLEEAILTGEYTRGEALTEMALSKKLGVSRTPIRSALHRLAEDGLIDLTPNRGAVVLGVTNDDIVDIYKIRVRLEGLASAMATERIGEEQIKQLRDTVELSEFYLGKSDVERVKELDTEFHSIIYKASGNRLLCKVLSELHSHTRSYRRVALAMPGRLEKTIEEHKKILTAIESGNAGSADELTSLHVENAMNNMIVATEGK